MPACEGSAHACLAGLNLPYDAGRLKDSRQTSKGCCEKKSARVFRLRSIQGWLRSAAKVNTSHLLPCTVLPCIGKASTIVCIRCNIHGVPLDVNLLLALNCTLVSQECSEEDMPVWPAAAVTLRFTAASSPVRVCFGRAVGC